MVVLTGLFLTGSIGSATTPAYAEFANCGQGLRVGGDIKLRGVLVGKIELIERVSGGDCRIKLGLFPSDVDQIPANSGAQIRAKTVFGEKWVEILYPKDPEEARLAADDTIPRERTIDPLEIETILNIGLPILDAIDPEHLAGALEALANGFVGHEEAAIRGIEDGIDALAPFTDNGELFQKGIDQLAGSADILDQVDEDLLQALDNLDDVNRFTLQNEGLIEENFDKTPRLLNELSSLFNTHYGDFTKIVNQGATVIGVVASRAEDLDRLLNVLPQFNSGWIRNLGHVCRYRQATDEPGKEIGERVPGRCWRVHNIVAHSRGAYPPGKEPRPNDKSSSVETPSNVSDLLRSPAEEGTR